MNDNIRMPYHETDGYVGRLVSDITEQAIRRQKATKSVPIPRLAVAVAATLLLVVGSVTYLKPTADVFPPITQSKESPVDEFLNTLTDEEVQMLTDYEVEEITVDNY